MSGGSPPHRTVSMAQTVPARIPVRAVSLAVALPVVFASIGIRPTELAAQSEAPPEGHLKWILGVAGALVVGIPAYLAEDYGVGSCSSRNCFAPIAAAVGGVAGFMLGAELDHSSARKWVAGPRLDLEGSSFDVPLVVDYMTPTSGGVALLGEAGMARANAVAGVSGTNTARGLLAAVVAAEHQALIAASASALLAFDENVGVRGARRVFGEGGAALAGDGGSRVILGGEGTLRLLRLDGQGVEVSVSEETAASDPGPARALVWGSEGVIWELAGARVVARSPESLSELGSVALEGPGRALSVDGAIAVVAGGESGVSVLDLRDPSTPRVAARYQGVRYAYSAALMGQTAYVAAGEQGLVTLDLRDPSAPVVVGVAGNLGMPYAVVRTGESLYVLDRENRRLHIVATGGRSAAKGPGTNPSPP